MSGAGPSEAASSERGVTDPVPTEIRAPKGARLFEVVWSDGTSSLIRHEVLRAYCPCAHCQGHDGPMTWTEGTEELGPEALELVDLREVGSYAIGLRWGDGHHTGIYTFPYLRELGGTFDMSADEAKTLQFRR